MNLQVLVDRYYLPSYEKVWGEYEAGRIDIEAAIDRSYAAWVRTKDRIKRETGYTFNSTR